MGVPVELLDALKKLGHAIDDACARHDAPPEVKRLRNAAFDLCRVIREIED